MSTSLPSHNGARWARTGTSAAAPAVAAASPRWSGEQAPAVGWRGPGTAAVARLGRGAHATAAYLVVLLVSTVVLRFSSTAEADSLLEASSTDVWHLAHDPLRVLVTSALWLPDQQWWPYAVVFACFMAPLERRVGVRWTVLVFLSGHVLATVLTEVPIGGAIWLGWVPLTAARRMDVGVSYGMYAVVAAYAGLQSTSRRRLVTLAVVAVVAVPLVRSHDMTSVGHALSVLIGLSWWPALSRRAGRAHDRSQVVAPRPVRLQPGHQATTTGHHQSTPSISWRSAATCSLSAFRPAVVRPIQVVRRPSRTPLRLRT